MITLLQYIIIGVVIIASIVGWNHIRIKFFKIRKEERYHDAVGSARNQHELNPGGHKK